MIKETYCDRLPRRVSGKICQVLEDDGQKCKRKAALEVWAHFEGEIYDRVRWAAFYVCKEHSALEPALGE